MKVLYHLETLCRLQVNLPIANNLPMIFQRLAKDRRVLIHVWSDGCLGTMFIGVSVSASKFLCFTLLRDFFTFLTP